MKKLFILLKSALQQAAGNLPGKEFCNFYIRSLTPQQATGNALAVAGSTACACYINRYLKIVTKSCGFPKYFLFVE